MKLIDDLKALHAKTTQGEYSVRNVRYAPTMQIWAGEIHVASAAARANKPYDQKIADAAFIAAAHNNLPAIAAQVARLEEALRFYAELTDRLTVNREDIGQRARKALEEK